MPKTEMTMKLIAFTFKKIEKSFCCLKLPVLSIAQGSVLRKMEQRNVTVILDLVLDRQRG